jgi:methylmalonyl-CoA mutase N-terminal domain/subunit
MRVDPAVEKRRADDLAALRAGRDQAAVDRSLTAIRAAANGTENMMPLLVQAAEEYITVGEICGVLREEWGEYQEVMTL